MQSGLHYCVKFWADLYRTEHNVEDLGKQMGSFSQTLFCFVLFCFLNLQEEKYSHTLSAFKKGENFTTLYVARFGLRLWYECPWKVCESKWMQIVCIYVCLGALVKGETNP